MGPPDNRPQDVSEELLDVGRDAPPDNRAQHVSQGSIGDPLVLWLLTVNKKDFFNVASVGFIMRQSVFWLSQK